MANMRDTGLLNPPIFGSQCKIGNSIWGIHCLWYGKAWLSYAGVGSLGIQRIMRIKCSETATGRGVKGN